MEKEKVMNNSGNKGSSSRVKGKEKEIINVSEITQKLDWVIEVNKERNLTIFNSKSEKDLVQEIGTIKENKLYHLKESERRELVKSFTGLDRILYEKLKSKAGSRQDSTTNLVLRQTLLSVIGAIPFAGTVAGNAALPNMDNLRIELEQTFTIAEVKEIIQQLGISTELKGLGELMKVKTVIENREKEVMINEEAYLKEKDNKEAEIARLETKLDEYKKIEQEKKERIIERLKKGNIIKSQEALTIEELKRENEKLIQEIEQLEIDRDDLLSLKSGYDIEINDLNLQLKGKDKRLKDWEEAYLKYDQNLKEEQQKVLSQIDQITNAKIEAETAKAYLADRDITIGQLRNSISQLEQEIKPSIMARIGKKTGLSSFWSKSAYFFYLVIFLFVLVAISYAWKNFRGKRLIKEKN